MFSSFDMLGRLRVAAIHFCISAFVVLIAGFFVVFVWYPFPYRQISGGVELLLLIFLVDVVLGPLMTFVLFNSAKRKKELFFDIFVIVVIQISAMSYGLWSAYLGRPVHLVFEIDRFRVVHASELNESALSAFSSTKCEKFLCKPDLIAIRQFKSEQEKLDATMIALQGIPLAAQSNLWTSYESSISQVLSAAKPVNIFLENYPDKIVDVSGIASDAGVSFAGIVYLPFAGRKGYWTILLDANNGDILGYISIDSFDSIK